MYTIVRNYKSTVSLSLLLTLFLLLPERITGQEDTKTAADSLAAISQDTVPVETKRAWNDMDLGFTTLKIGGGYILDWVTYSQDEVGKQQTDSLGASLVPTFKTRDARILTSGFFKTKMPIQWKLAVMYDGIDDEFLIRESGFVFTLKKYSSQIFIGRTKEGFSMPKIMNGHSPWTMERLMAVDLIPIMADGIRIYTFLPKSRVFWTLGAFNDEISKGHKFSTFHWQYLLRLGWLPLYQPESNKVLHVAGYFRYGKPLDGKFRARSRPESNPTDYFIDTGTFATDHSNHYGGEIYFTSGSLQLGSEFYVHNFMSDVSEDHTFSGGDVSISYIFTGESRPYTTTGNIYGFVPVNKPITKGGLGAWEGVLRLSSFDLNSGSIHGGKMWRLTPMVNWYMTRGIRMEFVYGYGELDRFGLKGGTHFFQSRIQFTLF